MHPHIHKCKHGRQKSTAGQNWPLHYWRYARCWHIWESKKYVLVKNNYLLHHCTNIWWWHIILKHHLFDLFSCQKCKQLCFDTSHVRFVKAMKCHLGQTYFVKTCIFSIHQRNNPFNIYFELKHVIIYKKLLRYLQVDWTSFMLFGLPFTFWLAIHGKPVLFWKGISGLKFPCFLFYAC